MPYVIKAALGDVTAKRWSFHAVKTMYRGKDIALKDEVFIFDSENEGGQGLIARGAVSSVSAVARPRKATRYTPRVSLTITRTATAKRRLGRDELRKFTAWDDGRPQSELHFKLYRQATNKIAGISLATAKFLRTLF
jgi:hypothetical protein